MASAADQMQTTDTTKRTRVLMTATLLTPDGAQKVRIRDISQSGAQITAEESLISGCDAVFKRGSLFAAARVSCTKGKEASLRFYRELTAREVDSMFHLITL